jgi:hypothetical protein
MTSAYSDIALLIKFRSFRKNISEYVSTNINNGIGIFDLTKDVIPVVTDIYSLGSSTSSFKDLYISSNTIYVDNVPFSFDSKKKAVNLPKESLIGGINPFNIRILGTLYNINDLLTKTNANITTGYIIDSHLWVSNIAFPTELKDWVDFGSIKGPIGERGDAGPAGPTGLTGPSGTLKIRADPIPIDFIGKVGEMIFNKYNNYIYIYNGNNWSMLKMTKI